MGTKSLGVTGLRIALRYISRRRSYRGVNPPADGVGGDYPGNVGCFRQRLRGFRCGDLRRWHFGWQADSLAAGGTEPALRLVLLRTLRPLHHQWRCHRNLENSADYMRSNMRRKEHVRLDLAGPRIGARGRPATSYYAVSLVCPNPHRSARPFQLRSGPHRASVGPHQLSPRRAIAPAREVMRARRDGLSHLDSSQLHAVVVAASRLFSTIPAMIKLRMTAANSSNQPQYWTGWRRTWIKWRP